MNFLTAAWKRWRQAKHDRRLRKDLERIGSAQDVFTHYYRTNRWGSEESRSGAGSTLAYTENLRKELPSLLQRLKVQVFLDAPCGDYNWFHHVSRPGVRYIGGDIVRDLVDDNVRNYGADDTRFIQLDITRDRLPQADIWLCRDVLFHLSYADATQAIENFLTSDIPWLLTTTHPNRDCNRDIPTGSFRELNLCLPPFNFPPPQVAIDDWIEGFPVRQLGLWSREDLQAISKQIGRAEVTK